MPSALFTVGTAVPTGIFCSSRTPYSHSQAGNGGNAGTGGANGGAGVIGGGPGGAGGSGGAEGESIVTVKVASS